MIIPLTLLFGAVGYLYYNSKEKLSVVESNKLEKHNEQIEDDDLFNNLEDLFI